MFMYHHRWGMMLGMFLFWLLAIGGGVWLPTRLFPATPSRRGPGVRGDPEHKAPALQIIRQRYANGEITAAEYEELLRTVG